MTFTYGKSLGVMLRKLLTGCGFFFASASKELLSSFCQAPLHGFRPSEKLPSQHLQQYIDVMIQFGKRVLEFGDLPATMQDGRVVATAKIGADFR